MHTSSEPPPGHRYFQLFSRAKTLPACPLSVRRNWQHHCPRFRAIHWCTRYHFQKPSRAQNWFPSKIQAEQENRQTSQKHRVCRLPATFRPIPCNNQACYKKPQSCPNRQGLLENFRVQKEQAPANSQTLKSSF